jgi:LysM repeat protein
MVTRSNQHHQVLMEPNALQQIDRPIIQATGVSPRRLSTARVLTAILLALSGVLLPAMPAAASDAIPPEAAVRGVIGHPQSYTLSCESRSAADWSAYFGVSLTEKEIVAALPRTDDPETGFVGSPSGDWGGIPPQSYGVHPPALAKVLRDQGVPAQEQTGFGWDNLRREIAAGKPVIVWVIAQMWNGTPIKYTASDGQTTTVAHYEHSMILVGYDETTVHVVDAYSGMDEYFDVELFLNSWEVLGERAITYVGNPPARPTPGPGSAYTVQRGETLSQLAERYGVAWTDLAALNGIQYPYLVYAGQQITIQGAGASPAALTPSPTETPAPQPTETLAPESTPTSSPTIQPEAMETVIVNPGDTLMKIAWEHGVALQDLAAANQLQYPYTIFSGQLLNLPARAAQEPDGSLTPASTSATTGDSTYSVQRGDYLFDLARRFGLDWQMLADINGISYPYRVYPGQIIKLH